MDRWGTQNVLCDRCIHNTVQADTALLGRCVVNDTVQLIVHNHGPSITAWMETMEDKTANFVTEVLRLVAEVLKCYYKAKHL